MMSVGAGMIPLIGGIRSNRTLMGCLHPNEQLAVIRKGYDVPVVVTADELMNTYNDEDKLIILDNVLASKHSTIRGIHKVPVEGHKLYTVCVGDKKAVVSDNHKWLTMSSTQFKRMPVLKETTELTTDDLLPLNKNDNRVQWINITAIEEYTVDCEYLVDIDVDDHVYMLANGMFTHNSKYANQAVSLPQRQAPLVRRQITLADGSESTTEAMMGKTLGAKFAPVDGVVTAVDNDSIKIKGKDGRTVEIDLYNNFPANQKGWLSNYPTVKVGDRVTKNQCIAPSNYTDEQGVAALGTNLRVAFLNGKNAGTFEDAITISEEAAQLLASEQMYKMRAETTPDMEYSKTKYLTLFRTDDMTKEQLDKVGDDGVALEGVTLQKGDPIYLGVRMKDPGAHGVARKAYAPYVQTWEHDTPGEVVAVTRGKDHIQVYTKTYTPMEVGDKMCYSEDTEIFTRRGWVLFKDLVRDDEVYTIDTRTGDTYFTDFSSAYSYQHEGLMYHLKTSKLDILVTDNHKHLVMRSDSFDRPTLRTSEDVFGKTMYHLICDDITKSSSYACSKEEGAIEEWKKYKGRVYCVEVPFTHTVFVRRKGKTWFSGNSNRYGAKGVVSQIIPTDKMPRDSQGRPFHVLQSPLGLSSRINTSQLVDVQLGKVAALTGQPIALPDFMKESVIDYTQNLLKQHGLSETEDVYDPETGKTIPGIETGVMFTYKLKHMAESKQGGRSTGEYTMEELPMKGGDTGCFVWNTLVWTDQGPVPIGDICDRKDTTLKAMSYDSDTDTWVYCNIVDHFIYTTDRLVNIKTHIDDSSLTTWLQATPNHVVYDWNNNRILAGDLQPGTVLRSWSYEKDNIVSHHVYVDEVVTLHVEEPLSVYDIEVEDAHNYTVGVGMCRFLVSNSRRFGSLEVGALLAGGGDELMRDAKLIRGQENNEFWRVFRDGDTPDTPRWPLVHKKFFAHLKAAGINLEDKGDRIHMYGATDSDIKKLTHTRKVTEPATFDSKNFHPIDGGMFDPKIFGDQGDQWGYYELSEPVLNPLMFKSVANALGWKVTELDELLAGKREINGRFGTDALKHALESIDIEKELRTAKDTLKSKSSTLDAKNKAIKRIRALEPMKREGKRPEEFLLTRIPILPPVFRAVAQMSNKVNIAADVNFLYKRMMEADKDLKEAKGLLPEDALMDARGALYRAVDAAIGVAPTDDPKLESKQVGGVLKWAFGKGSPKCYDDETDVLTYNGWMRFADYTDPTIPVATMNPTTGLFEWQPPINIIHAPYVGQMVHTHTTRIDTCVTPNHDHYVSTRVGRTPNSRWSDWHKVEAMEIATHTRRQRVRVSTDGFIGTIPACAQLWDGTKETFAEFIGWYLADGSVHQDDCSVYIDVKTGSLKDKKLSELLLTVKQSVTKIKRTVYVKHERKNCMVEIPEGYEVTRFTVISKPLAEWVRANAGTGSSTKQLSREILEWDKKYLIALWKGYHAGDGYKYQSRKQQNGKTWFNRSSITNCGHEISTVSSYLVDNFEEIGAKIGLQINKNQCDDVSDMHKKPVLTISMHGFNYSLVEYKKQHDIIDYNGYVHCVEVPNGLVITRRNHKVIVSGNCGSLHRKIFGASVDLGGRGVIVPDNSLDMDQVGLPEPTAWRMYEPFVMRKLRQRGYTMLDSIKMTMNKTDEAKRLLKEAMSERPILMNRAPTLWQYGIRGFYPVLTDGNAVHINPNVCKPFNADHDGDQVALHVPTSDQAVRAVKERMMPSRSILSPKDLKAHYLPVAEFTQGLYLGTRAPKGQPIKFRAVQEMMEAVKTGKIAWDQAVEIPNE